MDVSASMLECFESREADLSRWAQAYLIIGCLPLRITYRAHGNLLNYLASQVEALASSPFERNIIAKSVIPSHLRTIEQVMGVY